jgi:hypothetical protein
MVSIAPTQGPLGIPFRVEDVVITADAAVSKGQVCKLTLDTSNLVFDAATPAAAADAIFDAGTDGTSDLFHLFGVALEDIAINKKGSFRLKGVVEALGGDTTAAQKPLKVGADGELVVADADPAADGASNQRVIAISLETLADATLKKVLFDGLNGFGAIEP